MVQADGFGRYRTRVRGLPETVGEVPATTLAEEMETAGDGQVRALLTFAGNPALAVPNGRRLEKALGNLDFMVAIDGYINETTRFADIVLPPASVLTEEHADFYFANVAVRDSIRWTRPVVERGTHERAGLGDRPRDRRADGWWHHRPSPGGRGLARARHPHDAQRARRLRAPRRSLRRPLPPLAQRADPRAAAGPAPRRRSRPTQARLPPPGPPPRRAGSIAPALVTQAMGTLATELATAPLPDLVLIGRRELRSNNSWMHNVPKLVAGKQRCVLYVHPSDAARVGVGNGERATMRGRIHEGAVEVKVTDEVRAGVVSLPHGYGHGAIKRWQRVAGDVLGQSLNDWVDDGVVDGVVGMSVLNGVPVELTPAR